MESSPKIFLVGNPNVGKSVIFGYLTGVYATVSNYPGTTVALCKGSTQIGPQKYEVIDTPGINSLLPMSEDEAVTRNILLEQEGIVVQVADAKNLSRALSLTLQLQEMGVRQILVVNMCDEATRVGMKIDTEKLEKKLGIPVIPTIATQKNNLHKIKERLEEANVVSYCWSYSKPFEDSLFRFMPHLPANPKRRAWGTMLLSGDRTIGLHLDSQLESHAKEKIQQETRQLAAAYAEPISFLLHRERQHHAQSILSEAVQQKKTKNKLKEWLSRYTMHPFWGIVSLALILYGVYLFVGQLGAGIAVDFIETHLFGKYVSPAAIRFVDYIFPFTHTHLVEEGALVGGYELTAAAPWFFKMLHDCLVGPYGLVTMGLSYGFAIVLPIVTTFFIAFSMMEDSGYLPRLAVMVNRCFKWMGLNGKAVLPMVLGLGCDTMATLTTRILETRKQRVIVTLLLALAVPCSAQLGVLLGMFGNMPAWTFFVWIGILLFVMFFVGFASSKILPGESSTFIMEIPPLRLPSLGNVAKKTLSRLEWYVKEAVPLFLLGTFFLFLLDALHLLQAIQRFASPLVVSVLGLPKEAANAFLIGFLRRDYGATGFFDMYSHGALTVPQALVALVVITLFIPCVANVFMMVKEVGGKVALRMVCFIFPFAFLVGGILNWIL